MSDIIERLKAHSEALYTGKGSTVDNVAKAEKTLGVRFAADYRRCLLEYGVIAYDGHELTGISDTPRLDVVEATRRQRGYNPGISTDWYTIEEANIDGITIWQDAKGVIFGTVMNGEPIKLADNLPQYLRI